MDMVLLVARVLLAAVLGIAGGAKLIDAAGSEKTLLEFGTPRFLARPIARILPLAECTVALLLLPGATAWAGAVGTLVLLLLFTGGIAINMALGGRPHCHCFGQLYTSPVTVWTLIRNVALIGIAAWLVAQGPSGVGPGMLEWARGLTLLQAIFLLGAGWALGVLAVQGWMTIHLLRQNGRLLVRIESLEARLGGGQVAQLRADQSSPPGLPIGATAPQFRLQSLAGGWRDLDQLRAEGKPILLVFVDPQCGPCMALMPEIARWQHDHGSIFTTVLVSRGAREAHQAGVMQHGLNHVLLQADYEVARSYEVFGTPSAVLVLNDGTIGSQVATGADFIRALVTTLVRKPSVANVSSPCPCGKPGPCECSKRADQALAPASSVIAASAQ